MATVTVAAPECAQAEVAAKTALLLGPTAGVAWLDHLGLEGRLVLAGGEETFTSGWPAPE